MSFRVFTASGSFSWPEDMNQVNVHCWGGGGGGSPHAEGEGGGGGGAYAAQQIWTGAGGGGGALTITVGLGGGPGVAGGDSKVTFAGGSDVCKAVGGLSVGGTSRGGGAGGNQASCLGSTKLSGGNGGTSSGANAGGAGGGAGAGRYGAVDVGDPNVADIGGNGGVGANGGGSGGKGGNYGTPSTNGENGTGAGGGGGGGGKGATAGSGAPGLVIVSWNEAAGFTRFSSKCCCGVCDLGRVFLPGTVSLSLNITPTNDPDLWGTGSPPYPSEYPQPGTPDPIVWQEMHNPCIDPFDFTEHTITAPTTTSGLMSQDLTTFFNSASPFTLQNTYFDVGFASTYIGAHHFCEWTYECPLVTGDANIETVHELFGLTEDRACNCGAHPHASEVAPTATSPWSEGECPDAVPVTFWSTAFSERSNIWAKIVLFVRIMRKYPEGTFGWRLSCTMPFRWRATTGFHSYSGDTDVSEFTESGVTGLSGAGFNFGFVKIHAATFATADDAYDDMKAFVATLGDGIGEYFQAGYNHMALPVGMPGSGAGYGQMIIPTIENLTSCECPEFGEIFLVWDDVGEFYYWPTRLSFGEYTMHVGF